MAKWQEVKQKMVIKNVPIQEGIDYIQKNQNTIVKTLDIIWDRLEKLESKDKKKLINVKEEGLD